MTPQLKNEAIAAFDAECSRVRDLISNPVTHDWPYEDMLNSLNQIGWLGLQVINVNNGGSFKQSHWTDAS